MRIGAAHLGLALAASCAGACAATPAKEAASAAAEVEGVTLGVLADSAIPSGECGMVLWALDDERPNAVFRYLVGKKADIVRGGARAELTRSSAEGAAGYGVSERQTFVDGAGLSLTVDARFGLSFEGGSYLEKGVIIVETAEGWRTVVPVAGLAGCRP